MIRLAGKVKSSIVDGPGFRYTLFLQGCSHRCSGCHNPQTWDMNGGKAFGVDELVEDIQKEYYIDGVTISGGDPLEQAKELLPLLKKLKALDYHIILFSGYTFEEIMNNPDQRPCLDFIDVLIDGEFIEAEKSLSLRFRGSKNQRVIDIPKTLTTNSLVFIDWDNV